MYFTCMDFLKSAHTFFLHYTHVHINGRILERISILNGRMYGKMDGFMDGFEF